MSDKETIEGIHALVGISPDDQLLYMLKLDKEHHAAYAVLVQPSLDAIRAIVAEEVRKALADVRHEEHVQLRDLVQEYQRLVNSYHECYPYPEDLAPSRDALEERAKPFLEE